VFNVLLQILEDGRLTDGKAARGLPKYGAGDDQQRWLGGDL